MEIGSFNQMSSDVLRRCLVILSICRLVLSLDCYFCDHSEDYDAKKEDKDLACLRNFTTAEYHRRPCIGQEVCQTIVVWKNGAFLKMQRGCNDKCHPRCLFDTYGLTTKTCSWCCNDSDLCNNRSDRDLFFKRGVNLKPSKFCIIFGFIVFHFCGSLVLPKFLCRSQ